jgi:hypothetical protein
MHPRSTETLTLIRDTLALLKEEAPPFLLTTQEDADYFRKLAKTPTPAPIEIPKSQPAPQKSAPPPLRPIEEKKIAPIPPAPEPVKPLLPVKLPLLLKEEPPPHREEDLQKYSNFSDLKEIFSKIAPGFSILSQIPSDAIAKKLSTRWKTKNQTAPITLLSFQEPPQQRALLEQIAKALDVYFGPVRLVNAESIEKEKQWEAFLSVSELKLVIACDYTLWQLSGLMQTYKENPTQGTRCLGKVPLFLLPDLSLYLKDPLLKRSLWKALNQAVHSVFPPVC